MLSDNNNIMMDVMYSFNIDTLGADPEEIPAENPGEREGAAGAEEGCGDSQGEY